MSTNSEIDSRVAGVSSEGFYDFVWESEWFDMERFNPTARHLERIILQTLANLGPIKTLLDVGCGAGVNIKPIRGRFPELDITGADVSPKSLELAVKYVGASPKVHYEVLNAQDAALTRQFDVVLCSQVLEHIEDDRAAISNLAQMTGQWLLLTVPGGAYNSTSRLVGHYRHYGKKQLVDLVNETNLKIVKACEWGFPFHSLYKRILSQLPVEAQKSVGLGKYGWGKRMISHILYLLFYANRFDLGANVILLAHRERGS